MTTYKQIMPLLRRPGDEDCPIAQIVEAWLGEGTASPECDLDLSATDLSSEARRLVWIRGLHPPFLLTVN